VHQLTETVSIPLLLLKELYEHFDRIEEILATLEELSDKKGLKRIEKSLEEYKKKEYIAVASPDKIRDISLSSYAASPSSSINCPKLSKNKF
jgi:hypothetical protein